MTIQKRCASRTPPLPPQKKDPEKLTMKRHYIQISSNLWIIFNATSFVTGYHVTYRSVMGKTRVLLSPSRLICQPQSQTEYARSLNKEEQNIQHLFLNVKYVNTGKSSQLAPPFKSPSKTSVLTDYLFFKSKQKQMHCGRIMPPGPNLSFFVQLMFFHHASFQFNI